MYKAKILLMLILIISISGCGLSDKKKDVEVIKDNGSITKEEKSAGSTKLPETLKNVEPEKTTEPAKTEQTTVTKVEATKVITETFVGVKMDFKILNTLDNTKYAWWISLNKEHKTPGSDPATKKFVENNGGVYVGDTTKKEVYLTFDEGYENGYTPKILDILKENDVKAIFFITGDYLKTQPALVKRMLDEGHQVGNHTINHPSLPTLKAEALENELLGLETKYFEATGKRFKYMRTPMGEYSEKVLAAAQQLGYKTIFWSFAYLDYDVKNQKGADYAYKMVMDNLHNGAVYLLHAVSKSNTEALDSIIKAMKAQGYTIKPFDL